MDAPIAANCQSRAPYACDAGNGRGRLYSEPPSPTRTDFQRDRDRIIHSTAFRRLTHKTQVFIYHEGDHYRTRLTHSLEVSQVARALARSLRADEDLAEAVALAHDLGHPPFGHAGERALNRMMAPYGGFDHNVQSLRAVTLLERHYAEFDGLNLTFETLEGIVKHNGPMVEADGGGAGDDATCGPPASILDYCARQDLLLALQAGIEAQSAALADDIAYNSHDIDDGLRADLFTIGDVEAEVPFLADIVAEVRARYPGLETQRLIHEITRRVITRMVEDVLRESLARIAACAPRSADAVRAAPQPLVAFSGAMLSQIRDLRAFLFTRMYRHARVNRVMRDAETVIERLFGEFLAAPDRMPEEWAHACDAADLGHRARIVADYMAGMTDRFAIAEHVRLFDEAPELR